MPQILLNGKAREFSLGETILDIANKARVFIPTLCQFHKTGHRNVCRICSVEVTGYKQLLPACSTLAQDNMDVHTETPKVQATRKFILETLLAEGRHDCFLRHSQQADGDAKKAIAPYQAAAMAMPHREYDCPSDGKCELQMLVQRYKISVENIEPEPREYPQEAEYPMIMRDFSRCIQCGRCASVCSAIQVNDAIPPQFGRRSSRKNWYPAVDYSRCTHCGECVQACPTGALSYKKSYGLAQKDDAIEKIRTTCPYCGVGCQLELSVKNGRIIEVNGANGAPNYGSLCVKGRFGYDFIYSKERLTTPLIRQEDGTLKPASWDEALTLIAEKFTDIMAKHGTDAIAGVSCSRSINEDSYQMQKFFRTVLKNNNIDNCSRT